MSEFTPTTEQVQGAYAAYVPTYVGPRKQAFDRWLAQHDAEVRKQVAEEVAEALKRHADAVITFDDATLATRWTLVTAAKVAREIGGAS